MVERDWSHPRAWDTYLVSPELCSVSTGSSHFPKMTISLWQSDWSNYYPIYHLPCCYIFVANIDSSGQLHSSFSIILTHFLDDFCSCECCFHCHLFFCFHCSARNLWPLPYNFYLVAYMCSFTKYGNRFSHLWSANHLQMAVLNSPVLWKCARAWSCHLVKSDMIPAQCNTITFFLMQSNYFVGSLVMWYGSLHAFLSISLSK